MSGKRRFPRVRFRAKCSLTHNNIIYKGQLENISVNGALVSFSDGIVIPNNERCNLIIYLEGEVPPLRLEIEVIHSNFTMMGIRFATEDYVVKKALDDLVARLTSVGDQPDSQSYMPCQAMEG